MSLSKSRPVSCIAENFWRVRPILVTPLDLPPSHEPTNLKDIVADFLTSTIAEDNMNVQLKDITVTARDGRVSHLDQVYIRGSHVKFFIVPDMLRLVPFSDLSRSID